MYTHGQQLALEGYTKNRALEKIRSGWTAVLVICRMTAKFLLCRFDRDS